MDLRKTTMLERKSNKGKIAIFQIMVLVIGIMAFAFLMSGEAGLVSASDDDGSDDEEDEEENEGSANVKAPCSDVGGQCVPLASCEEGEIKSSGSCDSSEEVCCESGSIIGEDFQDSGGGSGGNAQNMVGTIGTGISAVQGGYSLGEEFSFWGDNNQPQNEDTGKQGDTDGDSEEGDKSDGDKSQSSSSSDGGDSSKATSAFSDFGKFFTKGVEKGGAESFWGSAGNVLAYAGVAAAGSTITYFIFDLSGTGSRNLQEAKKAGTAATAIAAGYGISVEAGLLAGIAGGWVMAGAAVAVALWTALNYQDFAQEKITFNPGAWSPPDGGENCEECNELRYGCSEYQCKTYGKACDIINEGSEKEKCVHISPDDTTPPNITTLDEELTEGFKYVPLDQTSPPDRGAKVVPESGEEECIPPYTSLTLGVNTSEPAECRMDIKRRDSYDDMTTSISQGYQKYTHPFSIPSSAMPSGGAVENSFRGNGTNTTKEFENLLEDFNLKEANDYEFYIRCKDTNGNIVPQEFVIEACVDDGPDTEAPEIIRTNYADGEAFVGYNKSNHTIEVVTNEPATCRWSKQNLNYDDMENKISTEAGENLGEYTYEGTLTGVKDREENKFYIKCQDKPWWNGQEDTGKPRANKEPYELVLKGTEPLLIDEATVNGMENGSLIKDSTEEMRVDFEVKTSSGANHGKSKCYYGEEKGNENIEFYNEGETGYDQTSVQKEMYFTEGDYTYYFKCVDEGGNTARTNLSFTVETDEDPPEIVRAFKEQESLKIITNEEGRCVYSSKDDRGCTYEYDEGIKMETSSEGKIHSVEWDPEQNFYIKCKDKYGNRALPGECSMVVRPYDIQS